MGFLSCFGCGSEKDELPENPSKAANPIDGANTEKVRETEANKPDASNAELSNKAGLDDPAQSALTSPDHKLDSLDTNMDGQRSALDEDDTALSPEQNFGAQHRIDDNKVQQAIEEHPYPISPVAHESSTALDQDIWHDADERLQHENNVRQRGL